MLTALFAESCLRPQALATQIRHLLKCSSLMGMSASAQGMAFLFREEYIHTVYAIRNAISRKPAPCTMSQANRLRSCPNTQHLPAPSSAVHRIKAGTSHMLSLSSHSPNPVLFLLRTQRLREVKSFTQDATF